MFKIIFLIAVLLSPFLAKPQYSLTPQQRYLLNEMKDADFGKVYYGYNIPRVYSVYNQLRNYSAMDFPIVFLQTFNWGQAHNGGLILLDYSAINKSNSVLAFMLAHEWGHEALGHTSNIYHPNGGWSYSSAPKTKEDAADQYAGRFLRAYNYDINSVTYYLRNVPEMGDEEHSTGPERANNVLAAFNGRTSSEERIPSPSTPKRSRRLVACSHPLHPNGDIYRCTHPAHPYGDLYPCSHICQGPYGYVRCHPSGDMVSCSHPMHPGGDVSLCTHPQHPNGDYIEE